MLVLDTGCGVELAATIERPFDGGRLQTCCGTSFGLPPPDPRYIWTLVHGDDCCSAGSAEALDWMEDLLAKKYEIKTQRIGKGKERNG